MKRTIIAAAILLAAGTMAACAPVAKVTGTQEGGISVIGSSPTFANSVADVMDATHETIDEFCGFTVEKSPPPVKRKKSTSPAPISDEIESAVEIPKMAAEVFEAIVGLIPTHIYIWSGKCR